MSQEPLPENTSYGEVLSALVLSESAITEVFKIYLREGKLLTYADFFGMGIGRRAVALSSGFRSMVEQRNSLCVLPLVRMQLDSALRLYAGFFVSDHQKFCLDVFNGKQINRIKSDEGELLQDKYLVNRIASHNPWITQVYDTTSGYIHSSSRRTMEALRPSGEDQVFKMVIGPNDLDRDFSDYREPMRCMHHLNLIIGFALKDWFSRMCDPQGIKISAAELWGSEI